MVQMEPERRLVAVATQSHQSLLAVVQLPASEAQEAAQPAVAAEVAVQPIVAAQAAEWQRYLKCWESFPSGQSLDQCCVAAQLLPDSSR